MDKFLFLSRKIGLGDRAGQPCGAARVFFVHADFELGPLTGHRPTSDQQRSTTKFSFEDPIYIMFPRNVILRLSGNPLPYFRALGPRGWGPGSKTLTQVQSFSPIGQGTTAANCPLQLGPAAGPLGEVWCPI